jgi:hypothetical protein
MKQLPSARYRATLTERDAARIVRRIRVHCRRRPWIWWSISAIFPGPKSRDLIYHLARAKTGLLLADIDVCFDPDLRKEWIFRLRSEIGVNR